MKCGDLSTKCTSPEGCLADPRWRRAGPCRVKGGEAQAYGGREGRVIEKRPSGWLMEGGMRERGRRGAARFRIKHLSLLILDDAHPFRQPLIK